MRSTQSLWLALLVLTIALGACKKGEEDPFFSLLSRKARVSGEWKLTAISGDNYVTFGEFTSHTTELSGDENTITSTYTSSSGNITTITCSVIEHSITINKDGTWSKTMQYNCEQVDENEFEIVTSNYPFEKQFSGTWAFIGKTKDAFKNKERIILNVDTFKESASQWDLLLEHKDGSPSESFTQYYNGRNVTYSAGEIEEVYEIVMLKSKEMKWFLESNTHSEPIDADGEPLPDFDNTFYDSETITWTAK
jgi:hypothetical protein